MNGSYSQLRIWSGQPHKIGHDVDHLLIYLASSYAHTQDGSMIDLNLFIRSIQ